MDTGHDTYATACTARHTQGRAPNANRARSSPVATMTSSRSNASAPSPTGPRPGTTIWDGAAIPPSTLTRKCATTNVTASTDAARCTPCARTRCRIARISRSVASSPLTTAAVMASSANTPA
ncbi:hypothetical protein ACFQHO_36425 [Actinomadura yumaensis]|uniref:hypothetical protein n=1 Tax=Actinomadura yumaensis TaxID=111807 RepID=UPI003620823C